MLDSEPSQTNDNSSEHDNTKKVVENGNNDAGAALKEDSGNDKAAAERGGGGEETAVAGDCSSSSSSSSSRNSNSASEQQDRTDPPKNGSKEAGKENAESSTMNNNEIKAEEQQDATITEGEVKPKEEAKKETADNGEASKVKDEEGTSMDMEVDDEKNEGVGLEAKKEETGGSDGDGYGDGDVEMKDAAASSVVQDDDEEKTDKHESGAGDKQGEDDDNNHKESESSDGGSTGEDKDAPQKQEPEEALLKVEEEKKADGEKSKPEKEKTDGEKSKPKEAQTAGTPPAATTGENSSTSAVAQAPAAAAADAAAPSPPPPVLKGTLSYNEELRRHLIRGMWNYENSNAFPPQRFELLRTLDAGEDPTELPKDGEFHGSFSLAYFHTTSKGKQKERSRVITEHGVQIKFTKVEGTEKEYKVDGKGTNQFGIFHINGTATPSTHEGDPSFNIVLRKRYEPSPTTAAPAGNAAVAATKKRKALSDNGALDSGAAAAADGPLPPPSKSFDSGVVCLRGKLYKEEAEDLGTTDVVHRINGMWANGLNLILADPQNVNGHCNRFEYEHKSSTPHKEFPVSGRYSGWFDITGQDGTKTKVTERDVNLRFQKNSAGYHNVEGRGSNAFGKYSITGTLSLDNVITIFRHFKPIKQKSTKVTSAPPPINKGGQTRRPSAQQAFPEPLLKLEDVKVPSDDSPGEGVEPITPPDHSAYSAVSRGVLKLGDDGSHTCQGKWAVTREHFTSGQTSLFNFRLEPSFALEAAKKDKGGETEGATDANSANPPIPDEFPLDSAMYRGSFQLKKGGTRYQTIVDQQIVMKFRKNKQGAYNVHGRGQNAIGIFNLIGTLIMRGKSSGQVELYRVYPPEHLAAAPAKTQGAAPVQAPGKVPSFPKPATSGEATPLPDNNVSKAQPVPSSSSILPGPPPPRGGLTRRESTRLVKLPSRLEDDDPEAQLARIMEKCTMILRQVREKDLELGAYFSEPVDPEAQGIPTYRQVISEPMDLGTVAKKMDANQLKSPEEFSRLVRLVFENAMKFNVDPTHPVHLAARSLLVSFNQKYRDIERLVENLRRNHKGVDLDGKKKKKEDKKRKRSEEPRSLKRRRHDEAQAMATANADAMAAIVAAAPKDVPNAAVSRGEFNTMIHMIQLLQKQIVQTHTALAELSPGDENDNVVSAATSLAGYENYAAASVPEPAAAPAPGPEKKKQKKKAAEPAPKKAVEEPVVVFDETKPLTLQEQETLTETINNMPADHIPGVIQIIRESASLADDEEEIDLEIDQLDTVTQRRLLRHVSKYIKQPKKTKGKAAKKTKAAAPAPAPTPAPKQSQKTSEKAPAKKSSPKNSDPGSFFAAFGSNDNSDSDSDDDDDDDEPPKQTAANNASGGKQLAATASKSDGFDLGDGFGGLHDDNDDDLGNGGITANWNISKAVTKSTEKDKGGDDDDWGAARKHAVAQEAREADRKAREEKLKAEAEETKKQRLADAAAQSEKLKAQRAEEEANEQQKKLEKEKEAKEAQEAARAAMRAQVESVEQTVDLDAQRDIMKQYEQSFLDKELGSASPSSDFGF